MRKRLARRVAPLAVAFLLTACTIGQTEPTPQLVTPPPSNVVPTVVVLTSTPAPGGTVTPPQPPGATTTPSNTRPATATPPPSAAPTATTATNPTPTVRGGTPTNTLPRTTKLTADGCCALPRWQPDGNGVAFFAAAGQIDPRAGTWRVPRAGGTPTLLTGLYGTFSPDMSVVAYPDGGVTRVARIDGTPLATIPNDGRRAYLPATNDRAAWMVPATGVAIVSPSLDPPFQITIAQFATGATVTPPAIFIGETIQWFPDGRRMLVNGRDSRAEQPGLWVLDTVSGAVAQIVGSPWLESPLISPDGRQIVYTATLQRDPAVNGVWLVNADGSGRRKLAGLAGGYRWLPDSSGLLFIPAPTTRPTDELWRYTLADNARAVLVGGEQVLFTVAQNEWEVAPDGKAIVYRSATDGAIWTIQFAP
jgi:hypothetical protein